MAPLRLTMGLAKSAALGCWDGLQRRYPLMVHVMVDDAAATLKAIVASGGEIVQPIGSDAPEITARFRDPAGNVIGLYQERR